jgi:4-hydroxy-L-threonine phosphate dehydrogenase PdxA
MRIAITLGDPNGIGPEIAIKAANHFAHDPRIKPLLVGDGFVIEDTANRLGLDATPPFVDAPALDPAGYAPGTFDPRAGKATVGYVKAAVRLVNEGKADAIIGCPHSETAVNRAGIKFSGLSRPGCRPHRHAARASLHDAGGQEAQDRAHDPARVGQRCARPPVA